MLGALAGGTEGPASEQTLNGARPLAGNLSFFFAWMKSIPAWIKASKRRFTGPAGRIESYARDPDGTVPQNPSTCAPVPGHSRLRCLTALAFCP